MKQLEEKGFSSKQNEEEQNFSFREQLCRGLATELQGDYEVIPYLIDYLNSQGFKLAPISKALFLKYSVISKERIENSRLGVTKFSRPNI
jgi:hypothetical protein